MNLLFDLHRKAQIPTFETDTVIKLHMEKVMCGRIP